MLYTAVHPQSADRETALRSIEGLLLLKHFYWRLAGCFSVTLSWLLKFYLAGHLRAPIYIGAAYMPMTRSHTNTTEMSDRIEITPGVL